MSLDDIAKRIERASDFPDELAKIGNEVTDIIVKPFPLKPSWWRFFARLRWRSEMDSAIIDKFHAIQTLLGLQSVNITILTLRDISNQNTLKKLDETLSFLYSRQATGSPN